MTFHHAWPSAWPSAPPGPSGWTRCAISQRVTGPDGSVGRLGLGTDAGTANSMSLVMPDPRGRDDGSVPATRDRHAPSAPDLLPLSRGQFPLEHLARGRHRDGVDEDDVAQPLVRRHLVVDRR